MAYSDGYQERRAGMSTGAKIAIALVLLIGLPIVAAMGYGIYSTFMVSPEKRFERAVAGAPEARGFVAALKTRYQGEYADMHEVAIRAIVQGGGESAAQRVVFDHLRLFAQNNRDTVALAPDPQLSALLKSQAAAARVTARHIELCRASISAVPQKLPKLNKAEEQAMEVATANFVLAAAAGRDRPVKRKPYAYADQQVLAAKMQAKGYTLTELDAVNQPASSEAAMMRKCAISSTLFTSLAALPGEQGLRIFSHLIGGNRN